MYADVVLLSTTEKGIQSCVDKFAKDWKMTIDTNKTKMLVFNKGGRLLKRLSPCFTPNFDLKKSVL
jgi:hypothetical protein